MPNTQYPTYSPTTEIEEIEAERFLPEPAELAEDYYSAFGCGFDA